MTSSDKVRSFRDKSRDYLDELMDRENTDEMGLLDLVFMEEILNQRRQDDAA